MKEVVSSKLELANIAGVPISKLVATGDILHKIITYIGQKNAKLEGEALATFSSLYVEFIQTNKNAYQVIADMLDKSFSQIDKRSVIYISKMLAEIDRLKLQEKNKVDIYKYLIEKRTEIEKVEKESNTDLAKMAMIVGGSLSLAALIFVGYKYARPKTIGDFLDKLIK